MRRKNFVYLNGGNSSCVDINLVVDDSIIVEAFKRFRQTLGTNFFNYITKDSYENNHTVSRIVNGLVDEYNGKIFLKLPHLTKASFAWSNNRLQVL